LTRPGQGTAQARGRTERRYRGDFRILKGIESDILEDGSLDYPDDVLASFDFVVASVHSRFGLDPTTQTERIVRAVSNPFTTILGHMTGRLLRRREGYQIDIERALTVSLPRMPARTFAVLMSLEPAFGVFSGLHILTRGLREHRSAASLW
jgi:hypothetical protein